MLKEILVTLVYSLLVQRLQLIALHATLYRFTETYNFVYMKLAVTKVNNL